MTRDEALRQCSGRVWSRGYGHSPCGKPAKHEHEGKTYCGTHYPPNAEERRRKSDARWMAEHEATALKAKIQAAERAVVAAAEAWFTAKESDKQTADDLAWAVARLRDLKAQR